MGNSNPFGSRNWKQFVNNDCAFDDYPLRYYLQQEEEEKVTNSFVTDLYSGNNFIAEDTLAQR